MKKVVGFTIICDVCGSKDAHVASIGGIAILFCNQCNNEFETTEFD